MELSLLHSTPAWLIAVGVFVFMMFFVWSGMRVGKYVNKNENLAEKADHSLGIGSLTGLLFFMLAFTFNMSGARYENRMHIIIEESNEIGTALARADLYPPDIRAEFRREFKEYLEVRIAFFEAGLNLDEIHRLDSLSTILSGRIWTRAATLAQDQTYLPATQQMIPALNDMMDITTARLAGEKARVPESIVWMLFSLALASAFFSGYSSATRGFDWIIATGSCLLISFVIYITLDLDRPRRGLINMKVANESIINLRKSFQ